MASVSSLDQDMRRLRMDRYTPAAANEARAWIESTLGERLPSGDLLDILKDGVALCRLANMLLPPPGIKYKASNMPFTQRENISHFLTACERPPLELPAHDRFLTVDLYDNKDPAQVLQCLGAFSRAANAVNPNRFPDVIGPKRQASPTRTPTTSTVASSSDTISRGASNASSVSTSTAPTTRITHPSLSPSPSHTSKTSTNSQSITSWSSKNDELTSAPAWNIHQYGYMGGASQGNQGISFGARRQIVNPDVNVPNLAEKEKRRREQEAEEARARLEAEQVEAQRKAEIEAQERQARIEEEERWQEETRKARERERLLVEEEKRRWEEEERKWKEEEERRKREEQEQQESSIRLSLRGQTLSQYQAEQRKSTSPQSSESARIHELERQLEEARERERQYQLERQGRSDLREHTPEGPDSDTSYRRPPSLSPSRKAATATPPPQRDSWSPDNRGQLRQNVSSPPEASPNPSVPRPLSPSKTPSKPETKISSPPPQSASALSNVAAPPQRPLPDPVKSTTTPSPSPFSRPLPDPAKATTAATSSPSPFTRPQASPFARSSSPPKSHFPAEMSMTSTAEQAAEDARRVAGQTKTKAGGLASKSLLEREMERERERQREWEQNQMLRSGQQQQSDSSGGSRILGPREPQR